MSVTHASLSIVPPVSHTLHCTDARSPQTSLPLATLAATRRSAGSSQLTYSRWHDLEGSRTPTARLCESPHEIAFVNHRALLGLPPCPCHTDSMQRSEHKCFGADRTFRATPAGIYGNCGRISVEVLRTRLIEDYRSGKKKYAEGKEDPITSWIVHIYPPSLPNITFIKDCRETSVAPFGVFNYRYFLLEGRKVHFLSRHLSPASLLVQGGVLKGAGWVKKALFLTVIPRHIPSHGEPAYGGRKGSAMRGSYACAVEPELPARRVVPGERYWERGGGGIQRNLFPSSRNGFSPPGGLRNGYGQKSLVQNHARQRARKVVVSSDVVEGISALKTSMLRAARISSLTRLRLYRFVSRANQATNLHVFTLLRYVRSATAPLMHIIDYLLILHFTGATVAERLTRSPPPLPPRRTGFNPRLGHQIFASGNHAGLYRLSAGYLPFPPPFHSGVAPSALKISLLRAALISSLTQYTLPVIQVGIEHRRNERAGETGDAREITPTIPTCVSKFIHLGIVLNLMLSGPEEVTTLCSVSAGDWKEDCEFTRSRASVIQWPADIGVTYHARGSRQCDLFSPADAAEEGYVRVCPSPGSGSVPPCTNTAAGKLLLCCSSVSSHAQYARDTWVSYIHRSSRIESSHLFGAEDFEYCATKLTNDPVMGRCSSPTPCGTRGGDDRYTQYKLLRTVCDTLGHFENGSAAAPRSLGRCRDIWGAYHQATSVHSRAPRASTDLLLRVAALHHASERRVCGGQGIDMIAGGSDDKGQLSLGITINSRLNLYQVSGCGKPSRSEPEVILKSGGPPSREFTRVRCLSNCATLDDRRRARRATSDARSDQRPASQAIGYISQHELANQIPRLVPRPTRGQSTNEHAHIRRTGRHAILSPSILIDYWMFTQLAIDARHRLQDLLGLVEPPSRQQPPGRLGKHPENTRNHLLHLAHILNTTQPKPVRVKRGENEAAPGCKGGEKWEIAEKTRVGGRRVV
ncbi:hypothetical protein PR048_026296 [Dryococelus australis]|uniref:Uncharacterized protein n=1 Tax=Dryococelus australis TaxID=614101 RepID=A0ABQ9GKY8_9NEOP|nr:hypothetical protein PR048_026296 [Dryococelus australis]